MKVSIQEENMSLLGVVKIVAVANLVAMDTSVVADKLQEVVKVPMMDTAMEVASIVVVVMVLEVVN